MKLASNGDIVNDSLQVLHVQVLFWVPATSPSRAQANMRAELSPGKLPTPRVRRRISQFNLSMTIGEDASPVFLGKIAVGQRFCNTILYAS